MLMCIILTPIFYLHREVHMHTKNISVWKAGIILMYSSNDKMLECVSILKFARLIHEI